MTSEFKVQKQRLQRASTLIKSMGPFLPFSPVSYISLSPSCNTEPVAQLDKLMFVTA
jgi:hypothetical protein